MARPPKHKTQEERRQALRDKSKHYYSKHRLEISGRRKHAYRVQHNSQHHESTTVTSEAHVDPVSQSNKQPTVKYSTRLKRVRNTNQYEVLPISVTVPSPPPRPDPFPKFSAEGRAIVQEFEDFLLGKTPSSYVESLLGQYFKNKSRRQGQISIFVEPLDDLYRMRKAYASITAVALEADGPSDCQKVLETLGKPIELLISWLEDIWRAAIDGPYHLRIAYNRQKLAWQRESS
ncbi:hypothetical protein EDD85DRAFT_951215 [Armillaria nabsnona]|nr:hypothetical protein EDD85DRAFT_951215 [Armillaria nabsnona]